MNLFDLTFFGKYKYIFRLKLFGKYKYINVNFFWKIGMQIYFNPIFFYKDEYENIQVYQKRASMNTSSIICTDIGEYKYKYHSTTNNQILKKKICSRT